MSKYNRDFYIRQTQRGWIRKQHLIEIKGGGCESCGYNKCSRCLSFHHREPKIKSFNLDLRNIGNRSWDVILREFEKCDLLCMNCHGEHHDKEVDKEYLLYEIKLKGTQTNICLNCGCEFDAKFSQIKAGGGKYCSIDCFSVGKRIVPKITKEELAVLLWQKPTTHIAAEWGVSDKAVDKWAKKFGLKKPPRGYWTKILNDDRSLA